MRKLKWEKGFYPKDREVCINGVNLACDYEDKKWCSSARFNCSSELGGWFDSLKEAQEDCVILAKQLLLEHHECLVEIMKSFGVEVEIE